jgi:O-antigen/teichoic acid export membrane protein
LIHLLFSHIGIYPYYGAITATLIGYGLSIYITLHILNKKYNFDYHETIKLLPKLFISLFVLIIIANIFEHFIVGVTSRISIILLIITFGLFALMLYYLMNKSTLEKLIKINIFKKLKINKKH